MGWLEIAEVFGLIVALVLLSLVLLATRRRWLDRQGGTFECSLRPHQSAPGTGWALGIGRYNSGLLEWFRFFSYSPRPHQVFPRDLIQILQTRHPDPVEAVVLTGEQRIISVARRESPERPDVDEAQWDLAMSADSLTGLLSWLEAAPPGVRRVE